MGVKWRPFFVAGKTLIWRENQRMMIKVVFGREQEVAVDSRNRNG